MTTHKNCHPILQNEIRYSAIQKKHFKKLHLFVYLRTCFFQTQEPYFFYPVKKTIKSSEEKKEW